MAAMAVRWVVGACPVVPVVARVGLPVMGVAVGRGSNIDLVVDRWRRFERMTQPLRNPWVLTAGMAGIYLFSLIGTSARVDDLSRLHERFDTTGSLVVEQPCVAEGGGLGGSWRCGATLTWTEQPAAVAAPMVAEGVGTSGSGVEGVALTEQSDSQTIEGVQASEVTGRTELVIASRAALVDRPYLGQRFEVFFDRSEPEVAYRQVDRLSETLRLYASLVGRLLLTVGSALWLISRLFAQPPEPDPGDLMAVEEALRRDRRARWAAAGGRLALAGFVLLAANAVFAARFLGAPGIL